MGCGTSKVLPEPPKDVQLDLVKKVEPYTGHSDIYKHFIRDDCGAVIKAGSPSPPHHANPYPGNALPAHQPEPRKNKVAKYRAKFDPRVTAKYDIKALIGRGSFSRVVRVEHKATKQPYAIKMIETKYREGREVCESELSVLRRVRHTNIIQLIEVFETQDRVYMVMELATGGELFDRIIAKGSFTERDATRVLQMVLDGVRYLHTLGITHRDLKPENLLYYHPGTDSKIMITDFGLASARKKGDDCLMKTTCGTPEYIAPEILVRKPYTNSVDMWALGVISYILLSGTMPFEDDNRTRLYRQILKGKYSYSGEEKKSCVYKRPGELVGASHLWKICLCTVSSAALCSKRSSLQSHLILLEVLHGVSAWEGLDAAGSLTQEAPDWPHWLMVLPSLAVPDGL
ncbi:serine/threonine-protein kinase H1 isoform X2 [Manacus candei]|uniref:serine/threonine-protein kinase H1 isoform X2 n=1 Tax=Manacus candei TaxID=415023 RepID=UPI0022261AA4|nr:serine/threonine-protein kinase H1 isoform X2 [Manacus candei]